MSEPQTPSGRALVEDMLNPDEPNFPFDPGLSIAKVEAESRDAVLDALEAAVRALPGMNDRHDAIGGALEVRRAAVLEAIQQQRRPKP